MALETYGKSSVVVTKADNVADWPANGMRVSDRSIVMVDASNVSTGTDPTYLQLTLDKAEAVEDGTADWMNYMEIVSGETYYIEMQLSPYAVNFDFGGADNIMIWVRH